MSRFKIYYTAEEITSNLYTIGKELMTTSNIEYIGLYHAYTTGEIYSQPTYDPKTSIKLVAYKDNFDVQTKSKNTYSNLKPNLSLKFVEPRSSSSRISKQNIQTGFITRYIIQQINNVDNIMEIDEQQYNLYTSKKIDTNRYFVEVVKWRITGSVDDITENTIRILGVVSFNQKQIQYVQTKMPNIQKILTNPLQHYVNDTFKLVTDINGLI